MPWWSLALAAPPPPIVGGVPADDGAWPPVASLSTDLGFACTGVLVTDRHVLTAGHCGYGLTEVRVGSTRLDGGGEVRGVAVVTIHPGSFTTLDLALVELDAPVTTVAPALLADGCLGGAYVDGAEVVLAGFGATDTQGQVWPDRLMVATTTLRDADCSTLSAGCNAAVSPGGEFVAGGAGVDTCSGDSGGPVFLPSPDVPVVVGITSRAAEPTTVPCGDGGIYARGDAAAAWLRELGLDVPTATCDNDPPALELAPLTLAPGELRVVRGPAADDPDQSLTITAASDGPGVRAWGVADALVVAADPAFVGERTLDVTVVDDGVPPMRATATVAVTVRGAGTARGCATVPGPAVAPLLGGLAAISAAARRGPAGRRRTR